MTDRFRRPDGGRGDDADAPEPESLSGDMESLFQELRSDLGDIRAGFKRAVRLEWRRFQLRLVDAFFNAAFLLGLVALGLAAAIAAAYFIAQGVRGGLLAWTEIPWVADLGAGLSILALGMGEFLALRSYVRNACVRKAKEAGDGEDRP